MTDPPQPPDQMVDQDSGNENRKIDRPLEDSSTRCLPNPLNQMDTQDSGTADRETDWPHEESSSSDFAQPPGQMVNQSSGAEGKDSDMADLTLKDDTSSGFPDPPGQIKDPDSGNAGKETDWPFEKSSVSGTSALPDQMEDKMGDQDSVHEDKETDRPLEDKSRSRSPPKVSPSSHPPVITHMKSTKKKNKPPQKKVDTGTSKPHIPQPEATSSTSYQLSGEDFEARMPESDPSVDIAARPVLYFEAVPFPNPKPPAPPATKPPRVHHSLSAAVTPYVLHEASEDEITPGSDPVTKTTNDVDSEEETTEEEDSQGLRIAKRVEPSSRDS